MGFFVLIRGPLGVGKTTICERLAEVLPAEHFEVEALLDRLGINELVDGEVPAESFMAAYDSVMPAARRRMEGGGVVVFEGCFYQRKVIDHIVEALPFPHQAFTLKAPLEICARRDKGRARPFGEQAAREVHALVGRFHYGTAIDATSTVDETLAEILSHLTEHS